MGQLLPDYHLLVIDEFSKFNSHDGSQEVQRLEKALDRLDDIYGKTTRMRCSDFVGSVNYTHILEKLQLVIEGNEELRNIALRTAPLKYRLQRIISDEFGKDKIIDEFTAQRTILDYSINEVACVAYLYSEGFRLKVGPDTERRYDKLMRVLNQNGRYGFRGFLQGLEFAYTLPPFSLRGKLVIPYTIAESNIRILLDDNEPEVLRKLTTANETALRYFATIGCAASSIRGNPCDLKNVQSLERTELLPMATEVLINGIIRPYHRSGALK